MSTSGTVLAIHEGMNPFTILKIQETATDEEIKKAYREQAKLFHPDHAGDEHRDHFMAIQRAYEDLQNPQIRYFYLARKLASLNKPKSRPHLEYLRKAFFREARKGSQLDITG